MGPTSTGFLFFGNTMTARPFLEETLLRNPSKPVVLSHGPPTPFYIHAPMLSLSSLLSGDPKCSGKGFSRWLTGNPSQSPGGPPVQKEWVAGHAPLRAGWGSQRSSGATAATPAWLCSVYLSCSSNETLNPSKPSAIFLLSQLARLWRFPSVHFLQHDVRCWLVTSDLGECLFNGDSFKTEFLFPLGFLPLTICQVICTFYELQSDWIPT